MRAWMLMLGLVACGGSASTPGAKPTAAGGKCAPRMGTYLTKYVEHPGGSCGPAPEQVSNLSEGSASSALGGNCISNSPASADNCTVKISVKCQLSGGVGQEEGDAIWAPDGSAATGLLQLQIISGAGACSSVYDITVERQR